MNQVKISLTNILLIVLPLFAVVLFVASVFTHNLIATTGPLLKNYSTKAQSLAEQNLNLSTKLSSRSSLNYLMAQANLRGFAPVDNLTYVKLLEPLAQR